jgi:TolB protein
VAERDGKGQIDVVDLEHNFKIKSLIDDDTDKDYPTWSSDGKSILYVGDKDGKSQVYLADGDGTHSRSLTDSLKIDLVPTKPSDFSKYRHDLPEEKAAPNWSPDGKHIAFSSWQGRQVASYLMDADGSNIHQILPSGKGGNIFWFDNQTLLFGSNRAIRKNFQLYSVKADGTGEKKMTDHGGGLFNLDISADNKRLLFDTGLDRIYLMNADGTGERILRFGAGYGVFWEPRK